MKKTRDGFVLLKCWEDWTVYQSEVMYTFKNADSGPDIPEGFPCWTVSTLEYTGNGYEWRYFFIYQSDIDTSS
jgi:hypothetical protein